MNWNLIGHEWAVQILKEHIQRGIIRHAYLITGPSGVGKRTLAIRLAQALQCPKQITPAEPWDINVPCLTCVTCTRIERLQHPDLVITAAEQIGGILKVDQIRELQYFLNLSPYEANYRIAMLLRFEEANDSAANALLKTLEEPAPKVMLVLTATNEDLLLPTIVSRCEVLNLKPVPLDVISQGLHQQANIPIEQAKLFAHISAGRPGYALRLLREPALLEQRRVWLDRLMNLLTEDRVARFLYAEEISKFFYDDEILKNRETLQAQLRTWLTFWRDVMLRSSGSTVPVTNLDMLEQIDTLANHINLPACQRIVNSLLKTLVYLERNVNTQLTNEVLFLDMPFM